MTPPLDRLIGSRPFALPCRWKEFELSVENVVGLAVAVALVGYLILALKYPEKF